MAPAVIPLRVELVEAIPGKWCLDCNRSGGVTVTLAMSIGTRTSMSTITRCRDCGGDAIEGA